MADQIEIHENRRRAESFGSVAENYDRFRPSYPTVLIDTLVAMQPHHVLDVGCGTGKAAVLFAAHGIDVLGVELDAKMADIARWHGIDVEVSKFEEWDGAGRTFDMIIAGQAWHWVDPEIGAQKAADLLAPGGTLALFWNTEIVQEPLRSQLDAVYAEHAPEIMATVAALRERHGNRPYVAPLEASGRYATVDAEYFYSHRTDSRDQWIGLISTHSDHVTMDPARREPLLAELTRLIDAAGGTVPMDVTTYLIRAKRAG